MTASAHAVLEAVARRLEQDPQHVMPTLRLLANQDALPAATDEDTIGLARRVNAQRLSGRLAEFRAQAVATSEVRELLGGVSRQAVSARVANRQLLAHEIAATLYFPDWQFGADGPVAGLARVVPALLERGRGPLAADALMRTPLPEAGGRSPAQLLAEGQLELALHYIAVAGGGS
jgi:hypothetical protein